MAVLLLCGTAHAQVITKGNTAHGTDALHSDMSGGYNTAIGVNALYSNMSGSWNTATGADALYSTGKAIETLPNYNTADGYQALYSNTTGSYNTAIGYAALYTNITGQSNIAIGQEAGSIVTTGSGNIYIGSAGRVATESNTIYIGNGQTTTFVSGIFGEAVTGSAVVVNSNGQLGVTPSSQRFKEDIQDMGLASEAILALRPVTYRYKADIDPKGTPQFGLVAEEVEKVSPDLVIHDANHQAFTVRYEAVNAMLLNEFRKQHEVVANQSKTIAEQQKAIEALTARLDALEKVATNR